MKKLLPLTIFFLLTLALHAQRKDSLTAGSTGPDTLVYVGSPDGDTLNMIRVEVAPQFPGGEREFAHFLIANIRYPQNEKEKGIQGRVLISFIVEKDGTISTIQPVKEVEGGPGLTKEAMRVLRLMPKWKPGTVGGKPVRTRMIVPVNFRLN